MTWSNQGWKATRAEPPPGKGKDLERAEFSHVAEVQEHTHSAAALFGLYS